jgi:dTMP kinase
MPFLTFEGIDGSGKSSLLKKLDQHLKGLGLPTEITREPGGSQLGIELREILLRTEGAAPVPEAELLIYEADRAQHVATKIRPLLKKNVWVMSDRFYDSSLAFQGAGRKLKRNDILWLNHFAAQGLAPDLTVLTDCPVEVATTRRQKREVARKVKPDRFEQEESDFHQRVRQEFLKIADENKNRYLVLDSTEKPDALLKKIIDCLKTRGLL